MARHDTEKPRKWARWQIVGATVMLLASIAMFVVQGFSPVWFGKPVDFGLAPLGLFIVAIYVLFGLNLPGWFGGDH